MDDDSPFNEAPKAPEPPPVVPVPVRPRTPAYERWLAAQKDPTAFRRNRPKRPPEILSRNDLFDDEAHRLCGARGRTPGVHGDWLCHCRALENGRCHMHGGRNALSIPASCGVNGRIGKRVRLLAELNLLDRFDEYRNDPELLHLHHELAIADTQIDRALKKVEHNGGAKWAKELRDWVETRRKLVDSINKNKHATVPTATVLAYMHAMVNVTLKYVRDVRQRASLLSDIRKLSGKYADGVGTPRTAPIVDVEPPAPPSEMVVSDVPAKPSSDAPTEPDVVTS